MDFFMQSKHLLALLCAICARLLSLPGICAQGADSLRYLLDDFVIMDSGEEDDVTTGALLYKMECVDLTRRGMATLADAVRRMPGARLHDYGGVGGLKTVSVRGLGEAAAQATVEQRKGRTFLSVEEFSMCCNKLSKTHIEQLKALGAFAGMAETSQITLF